MVAQGFLLFFLCGPLSLIHLRANISQRVRVITSTCTWYHWRAKARIPSNFQLCSSFKTQIRNDCTKNGSRVLTFPYNYCIEHIKVAFFKYNAISNVQVITLVSKFDFYDFNLKQLFCCSS